MCLARGNVATIRDCNQTAKMADEPFGRRGRTSGFLGRYYRVRSNFVVGDRLEFIGAGQHHIGLVEKGGGLNLHISTPSRLISDINGVRSR